MNQKEYDTLTEISLSETLKIGSLLRNYLDGVTITEEPTYPTRTESQRKAYFLWLEQIAEQCRNMGVTADMLFKHTAHISVTKEMLHHSIKALIKAKWNLDSTNDLRKTGHLDEIMDSVASWVGKENIEIPPFPSDDMKAEENLSGERIGAVNNLSNTDYKDMDESTSANKF